MKKIATITCLLLLTVGAAAAWAAVCCPPDHRMATQVGDDCVAPAVRVAPSPVSLDHAGTERLQDAVRVSVESHVAATTTPGASSAGEPRPGGASPAVSQTTPVLLR